jgi:uncharacterized protein
MRFKILFLLFTLPLCACPGYFEPWGNDSTLKKIPKSDHPTEISVATRMADALIRFHQQVISPVDGPRSHFRPSSSQYMHLAMHRYGFVKGFLMGCDRLMRENDDKWVYRTISIDGQIFKYDPALINKKFKE